jgi:hypothetical protein
MERKLIARAADEKLESHAPYPRPTRSYPFEAFLTGTAIN